MILGITTTLSWPQVIYSSQRLSFWVQFCFEKIQSAKCSGNATQFSGEFGMSYHRHQMDIVLWTLARRCDMHRDIRVVVASCQLMEDIHLPGTLLLKNSVKYNLEP